MFQGEKQEAAGSHGCLVVVVRSNAEPEPEIPGLSLCPPSSTRLTGEEVFSFTETLQDSFCSAG